jgi:hypothetical protein
VGCFGQLCLLSLWPLSEVASVGVERVGGFFVGPVVGHFGGQKKVPRSGEHRHQKLQQVELAATKPCSVWNSAAGIIPAQYLALADIRVGYAAALYIWSSFDGNGPRLTAAGQPLCKLQLAGSRCASPLML